MENWQRNLIIVYGLFSLIGAIKGFIESNKNKNAFGSSGIFNIIGAFVWGNAVVFGIFWTLVSIITFLLKDWILFLLTISIFWVIRGSGETIYWLNQQFSSIKRNPPGKFWFYKYFHNDSVWFVYQIIWQCVSVISIIFSIYLLRLYF